MIVDGNNLAYRNFITLAFKDQSGRFTGCMYGFLNSLRATIEKYRPDRTVVCWDHGGSDWRRQLFPEYKAHRKREDKGRLRYRDYLAQTQQLQENFLPALGVGQLRVHGVEGDDLVSLATVALEEWTHDISILSSDQDFYQLLSYRTLILKHKGPWLTKARFEKQYRLEPEQWPDVRALTGDTSDNIPGVRGIGPKRATRLIRKHKKLERVAMAAAAEPMLDKWADKVQEHLEDALLYRQLIRLPRTVRTDLYNRAQQEALEALCSDLRSGDLFRPGLDKRAFVRFCIEYEFQKILRDRDLWWQIFQAK